jgi:hypothetical protein
MLRGFVLILIPADQSGRQAAIIVSGGCTRHAIDRTLFQTTTTAQPLRWVFSLEDFQ